MLIRPFNSPLETGLRALFVLNAAQPDSLTLQRLVFYDYLALNSGDAPNGPPSIHPPIPHRGSQWLVRRDSLQRGLSMFLSRELISVSYTHEGLLFKASELTAPFLKTFDTTYSKKLEKSSIWVTNAFGPYSEDRLKLLMTENVGTWGAEFKLESLVRGTPYEL